MKLNEVKFGIASGLSISVGWIACSFLVWIFPGVMMSMAGYMVHVDRVSMGLNLSLFGVIAGVFGWALIAGFIGWLLASIYNKLL